MTQLRIGQTDSGTPVTIDPDRLIGTRMLVQANSGGGKSWMLRVLCERLGKTVPLVVLDWEGEFASLREKLDVLLVGRDGEIPTHVATAGALATQVLEMGVSAVIDLYDLQPQEKRAYVRRFLESLMAAPKRLWRPYLIIVDEAHSLVPQDGQSESSAAVNALMSQGRKRQFCGVLATQRLSKLHKDAAAEANNVLIGRCNLDVDQKRAGDVLGMSRAEYLQLRAIGEGQFYGFGPAFSFRGVELFKSADVKTTHGAQSASAKPPRPSALMRGVAEKLKDLAERSKTEVLDLDAARQTIAELRRQVAAKTPVAAAPGTKTVVDREAVAVAAGKAAMKAATEVRREYGRGFLAAKKKVEQVNALFQEIPEAMAGLLELLDVPDSRLAEVVEAAAMQPEPFAAGRPTTNTHRPSPAPVRPPAKPREPAEGITARQQAFLNVAATLTKLNAEVSRESIAAWHGIHPRTGSYSTDLKALADQGYFVNNKGSIAVTEAGMAAAGEIDVTQAIESAKSGLTPRQSDFFQVIVAAYPGTTTREAIAEQFDLHPRTGSFSSDLKRLADRGLVDRDANNVRGAFRARDFLFAGNELQGRQTQ